MTFTPRKAIRRARSLRHEQTEAEKLLWAHLRGRRFAGAKFVRQAPVGSFVADFLCREQMLIVEVDGYTHSENGEIAYDTRRSAFLEAQGYRVIRVQNAEVYRSLEGVIETIRIALEAAPR